MFGIPLAVLALLDSHRISIQIHSDHPKTFFLLLHHYIYDLFAKPYDQQNHMTRKYFHSDQILVFSLHGDEQLPLHAISLYCFLYTLLDMLT